MLNGVDGLAVTKLDVLDGLDTIRVCTHYEFEGKQLDTPPPDSASLDRCRPVYEDLPGWKSSTSEAQKWDDLPAEAQDYLCYISELVGAPVKRISTGAERSQTFTV